MQLLQMFDISFMQKYRLRKLSVKIKHFFDIFVLFLYSKENIQLPRSFCVIDDCKTNTLPITI